MNLVKDWMLLKEKALKKLLCLKELMLHGIKNLRYKKQMSQANMSQEMCQQEGISGDPVFIDFKFKGQTLPTTFDKSDFTLVFISQVYSPEDMYIQLTAFQAFESLGRLEMLMCTFYEENLSDFYVMKNVHIKVGAACVALWPFEQKWCRAEVLEILSAETVKVRYVDCGAVDVIPKTLLRYIKKEFTHLPAQGIRARLPYLKPAQNATRWEPHVTERLLEMVDKIYLMAFIVDVSEDYIFTIDLCNTDTGNDVYIKDELCKEGLADSTSDYPAIPFDAVFPRFDFSVQTLPPNFNFSTRIPVNPTSVISPGWFHIQLKEDKLHTDFLRLELDLNNLYSGNQSQHYAMKNAHIMVGSICAAQWPSDGSWYRVEVLSIPSIETVEVYYADYGTEDIIPKSLLRYLRKDFSKLPAQAIRSQLAFLKPTKNDTEWDTKLDTEVNKRLLHMSWDKTFMAKIEKVTEEGSLSIVLWDTNGSSDVCINDVLADEGLADYIAKDPNKSTPALSIKVPNKEDPNKSTPALSPEPPTSPSPLSSPPAQIEYFNISPHQALQARYFLQSFAASVPTLAENENYQALSKQVSIYCPNSDTTLQNSSQPFNPTLGVTSSSFFSSSTSGSTGGDTHPASVSTLGTSMFPPSSLDSQNVSPLLPPVSTMNNYKRALTPSDHCAVAKSGFSSLEESFESDTYDEMFHQLSRMTTLKSVRFVERVILDDGYKIHIIAVESQPFVSSGDISKLIWSSREADYLLRRLQQNVTEDLSPLNISEDGNKELFHQLERYNVEGVYKTARSKSSIVLYPLKVVVKILNIFGHPSIPLRVKLNQKTRNFNFGDPIWKEYSDPEIQSEEEEKIEGATGGDNFERLCIFDLQQIKEGIKYKRKIMNYLNNADEISRLEQMYGKIMKRIAELKKICEIFERKC